MNLSNDKAHIPYLKRKKTAVSWMESLLEFGGSAHWNCIWMYSEPFVLSPLDLRMWRSNVGIKDARHGNEPPFFLVEQFSGPILQRIDQQDVFFSRRMRVFGPNHIFCGFLVA